MRMIKELWVPQAVSAAMLLWALYPENSYGYYILLRWIVCPCFVFAAVQAFKQEKISLVWVLGVSAAIYNPILSLHLNRGLWSVLNLAGIAVGCWSVVAFKRENKNEK